VVKWTIKYTKRVLADSLKLKHVCLKEKTQRLLNIIAEDPYASPPYFEKLSGFEDVYSRRINIRHRLVYQVLKDEMAIKILSLWGIMMTIANRG
jgi:Txe/YoeB family toxin of toxin-antitoxin system